MMGLSPVHAHNHTITALLHQHFVHCEIFDVDHWNITQRKTELVNNNSQDFLCGLKLIKILSM